MDLDLTLPFETLQAATERVVERLGQGQYGVPKTKDRAGDGAKNNKDHGVSPRVSALYGPRATRAEFKGWTGARPKVRRE